MAAAFYFKLQTKEGLYSTTFRSEEGELYVLKCEIHETCYSYGKLTLEWEKVSSKFVSFKFYCPKDRFIREIFLFAEDDVRVKMSFNDAYSIIAANVTPHIRLEKCIRPSENNNLNTVKELKKLSTDMERLFQSGMFSDTVLTDGSNEIRAHRIILSTHSSVFNEKLQHSVGENGETRLIISDISIEVLTELLYFMYTGSITIKDSNLARDLYDAADKYDVGELKDICLTVLKSAINVDNALVMLRSAHEEGDKVVKEVALGFVSEHYFHLKSLQQWETFTKEQKCLALEVERFVQESEFKKSAIKQ